MSETCKVLELIARILAESVSCARKSSSSRGDPTKYDATTTYTYYYSTIPCVQILQLSQDLSEASTTLYILRGFIRQAFSAASPNEEMGKKFALVSSLCASLMGVSCQADSASGINVAVVVFSPPPPLVQLCVSKQIWGSSSMYYYSKGGGNQAGGEDAWGGERELGKEPPKERSGQTNKHCARKRHEVALCQL